MFLVTGRIQGKTLSIKWKNGVLSGDKEAVDKAKAENEKDHGYVGRVPGGGTEDYLDYEESANDLITRFVFDSIISEENDWDEYDPNAIY